MTEPVDESRPYEPPRERSRLLKYALIGSAGIVFLSVFLIILGGALWDHVTQTRPVIETVEFYVPEGVTGRGIGQLLADEGLLEHEALFRLAIMAEGIGTIQYGTYDLPRGGSPIQLLEALNSGTPRFEPDNQHAFTIPEGLTIDQMSALFETPDSFLDAVRVVDTFATLGVDVPTAEGFLMPNTYFFSEEPDPSEVVTRMLNQFNDDYEGLLEKYPDIQDYDLVKIVTVASLIEEEARVDEERPMVAAVIYNRLEKGMALEMDSTLQYILKKYGQRLLNVDKEVDSPYNTYLRKGLPPGPISNPGVKSIEAAMNPSGAEYLFFVSNADGKTHTFSETVKEHNSAVARYRREIREQRRKQEQQ